MNKIEIPLSKTKLLIGIGGSFLFVILGLYLFMTIADQQTRFNPTLVNMKMYGTPLSITSNTLKYNFNDLEKLLTDRLNEQRERMHLERTIN